MVVFDVEYIPIYLFVVLAFFLLLGFPVALTLAGTSIMFAFLGYIFDFFPIVLLGVLPNRIFSILTN